MAEPEPIDSRTGEDPASREFVELVFGVTGPVGTPDAKVLQELRARLPLHGYHVEIIKISQLIQDELASSWPAGLRPLERIERLIDEGNTICRSAGRAAALAERAIDEMVTRRAARDHFLSGTAHLTSGGSDTAGRTAFIVDSLKRPDEAAAMRKVYGDRFVLLGLTAPREARRSHLSDTSKPTYPDEGGLEEAVESLIERDETEDDEFGQDVAGVLPLADAIIRTSEGDPASQVRRILGLMFADPEADGPTPTEFGMQVATQAATTSPELGLRVGAAVLTDEGQVLATGRNHNPASDASPAFDAGAVDLRQTVGDLLDRMNGAGMLSSDVSAELDRDGEAYVRSLLAGDLRKSRIRDITEYQRPVHAEMDALLSLLKNRSYLRGARVYVTAFPCHNCAKHLIEADLAVTFLEPYAKSRVASMYTEHLERFVPFHGVTPRRYGPWFIEARRADRKDKIGVALEWSDEDRRRSQPQVTPGVTQDSVTRREDLLRREREHDQSGSRTE